MKGLGSTLLVIFIFIIIANFFKIGIPVYMTTSNTSSELSVVGEGKVDVIPDTAYVDMGIQVSNASTVDAAQTQINTTNNKIIEAMTALGIKKEDIKTSNYSIYPSIAYENNRDTITGYNGNVTITVKANKADQVSEVIAAATKAGANQIQGTRYEVGDPNAYRQEARKKAIEEAKKQAAQIAKDLDIRLGKVVNVVEDTQTGAMPYGLMRESAVGLGGGGGTANLEPGTETITSVVTLYFEKK
ncbi:MAG: SIMPL domain-containing protein [Weeksellaceae bacterium]